MRQVPATLFCFVDDFLPGDLDEQLDAIAELGVTTLALALSYHSARDITPGAPQLLQHREPGLHFSPAADTFGDLAPEVRRTDGLAEDILTRAHDRGLGTAAWTVYLHNEELGERTGSVTQMNCFGQRVAPDSLCPAHPMVRDYAERLTRSISTLGVGSVLAESLHFHGFSHGYHHERAFIDLDPTSELLLGLCFCDSCCDWAGQDGVDAGALRERVARLVEPRLRSGAAEPLTPAELDDACAGLLTPFLQTRLSTVTTLAQEIASATTIPVSFIDLTGASLGYADGDPSGPPAPSRAWEAGVDIAAISQFSPIAALCYARSPERVTADVTAYRALMPASQHLMAVLRPGAPDCSDVSNLRAKVQGAMRAGASAAGFYNLGMYRRSETARIPGALKRSTT